MTQSMGPTLESGAPDVRAAAEALGPAIAGGAVETEREGRVSTELLTLLRDAGMFRMWLPREVGGTQLDIRASLAALEEIARHDGSTGWITMIGGGTNFLLTALPPEVVHEVFDPDPDIATGGHFIAMGKARRVDGGYRVSGRWPFGSGCEHCTWLIGGATVLDGDEPVLDEQQRSVARLVLLPIDDVTIHDTWHVSGLRGTGSHDYEVDDLFVPEAHAFPLFGDRTAFPFPHARMPLLGMLAASLAASILGMARGALDALVNQVANRPLAHGPLRDRPLLQARVAEAEALVLSARAFVYGTVDRAWTRAVAGEPADPQHDVLMRLAASHAARACTRVAQLALEAGGTAALYERSPIQRFHRDIMAAQQHGMVAYYSYESIGKELLDAVRDVDAGER